MGNPFTRRQIVFGALLALLAVVMAVGDRQLASAEPKPVESYGSREAFERECARKGGAFVVGASGELACRLGNGSIVCDHRGNNCMFYPSAPRNGGQFAEADGETTVLGTGAGLPPKEPGGVNSVEIPGGSSTSPDGDIDVGPGDNVAGS